MIIFLLGINLRDKQNKMSTLAELNTIAQEIAQKIGHISQELLLEVHALVHRDDPEPATPVAPATEATPVTTEVVQP